MSNVFLIRLADLDQDSSLKIDHTVPSDFLKTFDNQLDFEGLVKLFGKAYLTDDHLIIKISAKASTKMDCSVCNGPAIKEISLEDHYITKPLAEIIDQVFDFSEELRQALLLETPPFLECEGGKCPQRSEIEKYSKKQASSKQNEEVYFPFENLDHQLNNEG